MHQAWHTEGKQQLVFVEEIQRSETVALAKVDGSGPGKTKRLHGNAEDWRQRWLVGKPVGQRALLARARLAGRETGADLGPHRLHCAQHQWGQQQPCAGITRQSSQPLNHPIYFRRCSSVLGNDTAIKRMCDSKVGWPTTPTAKSPSSVMAPAHSPAASGVLVSIGAGS